MDREIFRPRSYQRELRHARLRGINRFLCLWHRRAGKDRNAMSFALEEMHKRIGVYFHIFPSLNQGRRDLWDNIVHEEIDGKEVPVKMIDMIPPEIRARKDETDMLIELKCGSVYQVMGADSDDAVDRLRGPNPVGLIFSEYAHGSKMEKAWDTLSPVLAENKGWALFAYTPNGFNHGFNLYERVKNLPNWFVSKKTIEDTKRDAVGEGGGPVVSQDDIDQQIAEGKRPEFIRQEYYCDFNGAEEETMYGDLMRRASDDGRICRVPHNPALPTGVCFDLGSSKTDAIAAWFYQRVLDSVNFIDYYQEVQKGIHDWSRVAREHKQYSYGRLVLPWDGEGQAAFLRSQNYRNVIVTPRTRSFQTEVDIVRRNFSRFIFDSVRCERGIKALINYKRKFDSELQVFSPQPVHDQYSHGADALRTGVIGGFDPLIGGGGIPEPLKVETEFDPRGLR